MLSFYGKPARSNYYQEDHLKQNIFIYNNKKRALTTLLLLITLTHLPFNQASLSTDDYIWISHLTGSEQLYNLGLSLQEPNKSFKEILNHGFLFYSDKNSSLADYRNYGNIPWWGAEEGKLHPYRPISTLLLWLDMTLFGLESLEKKYLSRIYILVLGFIVFLFYNKVADLESPLRRPRTNLALPCLASLFLLFDLSLTLNFQWLAARNAYTSPAFGITALIFHLSAREQNNTKHYFLGIGFFIAAIFTAEAGLSIFGYLIAFAFFRDKEGWYTGMFYLLPYLLIIGVWRFYYNQMGFGASGNGLYIDPGINLFAFAKHCILALPQIFNSLITGIDGSIQTLPIKQRYFSVALSLTTCGIFFIYCWSYIVLNRTRAFLFFGSILSVIPQCATTGVTPRSTAFAALGFFFILAIITLDLLNPKIRKSSINLYFNQVLAYLIIIGHLIIPFLFCLLLYLGGVSFNGLKTGLENDKNSVLKSDHSLVFVNHVDPADLLYSPFRWDIENKTLPRKIQTLAPGFSSFRFKRTSEKEFTFTADEHFTLNHNQKVPKRPSFHDDPKNLVLSYRFRLSIVTNPQRKYVLNEEIQGAEMKVKILEKENDLIKSFKVTFLGNEKLEDKIWRFYNWENFQFETIKAPSIGEEVYIIGPYDLSAEKTSNS